jgi:preprotein translocase subunit SecG
MATIVLVLVFLAVVLALVLVASARTAQKAPATLVIERSPRRIRRRTR